ncbi:uncharacterized protein BKCO1_800011 [Diplodia corticola]|uniref:Uncharacterized protein n=1 Tax=Diplodia corticola TaxID=236234 RepID=A0A1J9SBN7_9PEZI|nr:uncharacterized protein BKCO1_800011 [Diplodia corticola]OJD36997.1 hypothetical protein BKCO1_800011 [Diplodia corticola]
MSLLGPSPLLRPPPPPPDGPERKKTRPRRKRGAKRPGRRGRAAAAGAANGPTNTTQGTTSTIDMTAPPTETTTTTTSFSPLEDGEIFEDGNGDQAPRLENASNHIVNIAARRRTIATTSSAPRTTTMPAEESTAIPASVIDTIRSMTTEGRSPADIRNHVRERHGGGVMRLTKRDIYDIGARTGLD